ncbi:hypothetical protein BH10PAT1_BH10PAT1_1990 [soil metagenome]
MADSFLHAKYYITDNPPWLSELIPLGLNKFAIVYPPAPALLLIPFVAIFGANFSQTLFANLIGAGIVVSSAVLCFEITKNKAKTLWLTLLVAFGNILWFMSSTGSVWVLGQTVAVLFLLLSILALEKNKSSILIGLLFGIAFLSRVEVIFAFPFFFFLIKKNKFNIFIGLIPFILFYLFYNFLRFNTFFETGYSLIPGVLQEPWYSKGIIHPSYILTNLKVMFTSLPIFRSEFPFIIPSWGGLSIWITTPAFIYSLFANIKEKSVYLSWLAMLPILLLITMHGETGYAQFGYRFAADLYPFLFFLIIKYLAKHKLNWLHWTLLILSIIVNAWGVILINKFGIVLP